MTRKYLTVEEVAKRLHMAPNTVRNRLSRGFAMPPSCKIGRRRLFPEMEFDEWMIGFLTSNEDVSSS